VTLRVFDSAPKPDEDVIRLAEQLLADARSGRCRGVIAAAVYEEPGDPFCTATLRAGTCEVAPMVVSLERAKLRILGVLDESDLVGAHD
jgi:hypothetical protein